MRESISTMWLCHPAIVSAHHHQPSPLTLRCAANHRRDNHWIAIYSIVRMAIPPPNTGAIAASRFTGPAKCASKARDNHPPAGYHAACELPGLSLIPQEESPPRTPPAPPRPTKRKSSTHDLCVRLIARRIDRNSFVFNTNNEP